MRRTFIAALCLALLAAGATVASASSRDRDHRDRDHERDRHHERDDDRGRGGHRGRSFGPIDPTYAKECGACHVAYPPALLPGPSWQAILSDHERHFGANAELEPGVRAKLERWILERAAPARRDADGASHRITQQPWFLDEHDELPRGVAARPGVGTMSNCAACHPGAADWSFDESGVRIPPG